MSRLWDKGDEAGANPLDERVLRYTAGEDHRLDDRLVLHEVRASIAHAEMLAEQGLLAAEDLAAIRAGLEALGGAHAAGEWRIELLGVAPAGLAASVTATVLSAAAGAALSAFGVLQFMTTGKFVVSAATLLALLAIGMAGYNLRAQRHADPGGS